MNSPYITPPSSSRRPLYHDKNYNSRREAYEPEFQEEVLDSARNSPTFQGDNFSACDVSLVYNSKLSQGKNARKKSQNTDLNLNSIGRGESEEISTSPTHGTLPGSTRREKFLFGTKGSVRSLKNNNQKLIANADIDSLHDEELPSTIGTPKRLERLRKDKQAKSKHYGQLGILNSPKDQMVFPLYAESPMALINERDVSPEGELPGKLFNNRNRSPTGLSTKQDMKGMLEGIENIPHRQFVSESDAKQTVGTLPAENENPRHLALNINNEMNQASPPIAVVGNDNQAVQDASSPRNIQSNNGRGGGRGIMNNTMPEIEAKLFLKRNVGLFITGVFLSMILLAMIYGYLPFEGLFIIGYLYLLYSLFESSKRVKNSQREDWRKREDQLELIETIIAIVFLVSVNLSLFKVISFSLLNGTPFALSALIYLFKSQAPKPVRNYRLLTKLVSTLQILLITLQLNGAINWDWIIVFVASWFYFGLTGIYLFAYATIFVLSLIFFIFQVIFKRHDEDRNQLIIQLKGLFWHLLYYGMGGVAYLLLSGFNEAYSGSGSFDELQQATLIALAVNIVLVIYTFVFFKPLTVYIQLYSLTDESILGSDSTLRPAQEEKEETKVLQVVQKNSYFVALSSTYFRPLSKGLLERNEGRLKEIKKMISGFTTKNNSKRNVVNVETLKHDKEILDKKLERISKNNNNGFQKMTLKAGGPAVFFDTEIKRTHGDSSEVTSPKKVHFSFNDAKDVGDWEKCHAFVTQPKGTQDDNLCYLCWANDPNALLMTCGHGGICYECAIALVNKKNECMQCREIVTEIHKIDHNLKLPGVIKAVEVCTVTKSKSPPQKIEQ